MSLIYLRKPIRICLTRSPKSSPIPSAVLRSYVGSMGGTSPELACRSRTASTSSTPTRLSLFAEHVGSLSRYADALRDAAFEALAEEAILVVVLKIYHAE
jgi:hypothetical protein